MTHLPVIVGFGGFNAAGRSSFHHGYRRMTIEAMTDEKRQETLCGLAVMMGLVTYQDGQYVDAEGNSMVAEQVVERYSSEILDNTLIRKITPEYFDVNSVYGAKPVTMKFEEPISFVISRKELPSPVPENWQIETLDDRSVRVTVVSNLQVNVESRRKMEVSVAGMLPTGFKPADLYNSRFHPKGLSLAIVGASDALNSMGIEWSDLMQHVAADDISVYAASALGQTDEFGYGGYLKARLMGKRPSSKQMALSLNSMPADFLNAYVCGSLGTTGGVAGACATFLYNLRLAVEDIKSGRAKIAICGSGEAPVTAEVIEGFAAMSALATDDNLRDLDQTEEPDHRRASRPFSSNAGFTIGESSQYFVLMADSLALELGAQIHGAVSDVFVNADGNKKSISSPGAGNYITMAKAVASAQAIVGQEAVQQRSFVQAHGSSTPQNRITESIIFDKVAEHFGINSWPVTAVKAFLGHPLGPASGDQLANTLGIFANGVITGISTIDHIADDVVDKRLDILMDHKTAKMDVAFLNSKGFGGNNATATVLSPSAVESILAQRHSETTLAAYSAKKPQIEANAKQYDQSFLQGEFSIKYNFGEGILQDDDVNFVDNTLKISGLDQPVDLEFSNPFI